MDIFALIILSCILVSTALAVYEDEAGVIDWNMQFVGKPTYIQFSPSGEGDLFFYNKQTSMIARVDRDTSATKWRYIPPTQSRVLRFDITSDNQVVIISSISSEFEVQQWDSDANVLLGSAELLPPDGKSGRPVAVACSQGMVVAAVDGHVEAFRFDLSPNALWAVSLAKFSCSIVDLTVSSSATFDLHCFTKTALVVVRLSKKNGKVVSESSLDFDSGSVDHKSSIGAAEFDIVCWLSGSKLFRVIDGYKEDALIDAIDLSATFGSLGAVSSVQCRRDGSVSIASANCGNRYLQADVPSSNGYPMKVEFAEIQEDSVCKAGMHGAIRMSSSKSGNPVQVVVSSSNVHLIEGPTLKWSRYEDLASARKVVYVDLPEASATGGLPWNVEPNASIFAAWLKRARYHLEQLGETVAVVSAKDADQPDLVGDKFGFRKLVVVSTSTGGLFAIETESGNVVWHALSGCHVDYLIATQSIQSGGRPEVSALCKWSDAITVQTYDALSGSVVSEDRIPTTGRTVMDFETGLGRRGVAVIDQDFTVHVYPANAADTRSTFSTVLVKQDSIEGLGFSAVQDSKAHLNWVYRFPADEILLTFAHRSAEETVASRGRVLGDRSVLYKYLNTGLLAFVTLREESGSYATASIYISVLDSFTGKLIKRSHLGEFNEFDRESVKLAVTENMIVAYLSAGSSAQESVLGERLVPILKVIEIHEWNPDHEQQNFSVRKENTTATFQTYELPVGVSSMVFSRTLEGITGKELIMSTSLGNVAAIPRNILDSRRPFKEAKALTAEEKEEKLVPYKPVIETPPQSILSHTLQIVGITDIATAPAMLESTTLIFAYGHDVFFTRHTPSKGFDRLGASFTKWMPVAAIVVLFVGVNVARFVANKNKLQSEWS